MMVTKGQAQKIAIIGTGAMGSIYAVMMAEAGHEVWAIDSWADHVDSINAGGLRLDGISGDRRVTSIKAATDLAAAGACDLYVIATKAGGVGEAARAVAGVMRPDSLILTIQNGLGAAERIGAHMPVDNVLLGVADGFGASMRGPGHAHHNAMRLIRLGEIDGGMTERLQNLESLWLEAGFTARAFDDITQLIWEKFVCNVTLSAPCTAFDCNIGELMANAEAWAVALGCAREAHQCGLAEGVNFSFDDVEIYVTEFASLMPDASPSLRLDHLAGRASEIDAINGMVPVIGARHGIDTPVNDTLSAIVRAREAAFMKSDLESD
jgi:2-dehydropantoate 2-reductase